MKFTYAERTKKPAPTSQPKLQAKRQANAKGESDGGMVPASPTKEAMHPAAILQAKTDSESENTTDNSPHLYVITANKTIYRISASLDNIHDEKLKAALEMHNKTPSGKKQFDAFISNPDMYAFFALTDIPGTAAGLTTLATTMESEENEKGETFLKIQAIGGWFTTDIMYDEQDEYYMVYLDKDFLKNNNTYDNADTIFHELKAHVTKSIGAYKTEHLEHHNYGLLPVYIDNKFSYYIIRQDSDAYNFSKEIALEKSGGNEYAYKRFMEKVDFKTVSSDEFGQLIKINDERLKKEKNK